MVVARRRVGVAPRRHRVCVCIPARLTRREAQVLEQLAVGLTSAQIGATLFLSEQAVTYHVGNLLSKFQSPSRTALVARAFVLGLLSRTWPPEVVDISDAAPRCVPAACLRENIIADRTQTVAGALR
jgi:DNA-binding CsgD family transcriptional regulator